MRVAIQVKGYRHSVGNRAVQEALAGMKYYDCDACAVITNSQFTASAKRLAEKIACVLVDKMSMRAFILGTFPPFESEPRDESEPWDKPKPSDESEPWGESEPTDDSDAWEAISLFLHVFLAVFTAFAILSGAFRIWRQYDQAKGVQNLIIGFALSCVYAISWYKLGSKAALFITTLLVVGVIVTLFILRVLPLFA